MDINELRSMITVLAFATFLGIFWWAFSRKSRRAFDEAALLPFTEDGPLDAERLASLTHAVDAGKQERKAS